MIQTARIVLTVFVALATLFPPSASAKPYNQSSHPPEFFRDLLAGRVFVFDQFGHLSAAYHANNGNFFSCRYSIHDARYLTSYPSATWRIGTPAGASNLELRWFTEEESTDDEHTATPYLNRLRRVIIYTPNTGAFHTESYFRRSDHWQVSRQGWIQNAWPKALLSKCPDLNLPTSLTIHPGQDTLDFDHVQATATPLRNYPGSRTHYPGATGIGAAGNQPTMTESQFNVAIRSFHGYISHTPRGRRAVFNILPNRRETWLLHDNNDLKDAGTVSASQDGRLLTINWQISGLKQSIHFGYPIPLLSTGKLHPAFAMMKDLAESARPVLLVDKTPHVFRRDGTVNAGPASGSWHISRGAIHIDIAGSSRAFPWREFAEIAGWKQ